MSTYSFFHHLSNLHSVILVKQFLFVLCVCVYSLNKIHFQQNGCVCVCERESIHVRVRVCVSAQVHLSVHGAECNHIAVWGELTVFQQSIMCPNC